MRKNVKNYFGFRDSTARDCAGFERLGQTAGHTSGWGNRSQQAGNVSVQLPPNKQGRQTEKSHAPIPSSSPQLIVEQEISLTPTYLSITYMLFAFYFLFINSNMLLRAGIMTTTKTPLTTSLAHTFFNSHDIRLQFIVYCFIL